MDFLRFKVVLPNASFFSKISLPIFVTLYQLFIFFFNAVSEPQVKNSSIINIREFPQKVIRTERDG